MNVISADLTCRLKLQLRDLTEVEFRDLFMKIADNNDIILHHWVWLRALIANVVRDIRCFVASRITQTTFIDHVEHLSLILRLSWLYSIDAFISIRQFKITINDVSIDEVVREMIDSELIFCKNHNLLMYLKSVMTFEKEVIIENADSSSSNFDSDSDDANDLSDVKDSNF